LKSTIKINKYEDEKYTVWMIIKNNKIENICQYNTILLLIIKLIMQPIFDLIARKNPDHARIRFYPSCTNKFTKTDDTEIISINGMTEKSTNFIRKYLRDKPSVSGMVVEYGLKDTFVRISTVHNDDNKSCLFFRRESHIINNHHIDDKDFGTYILELYMLCSEDDLPYIINYHHNIKHEVVTYTDIDFKICLTKDTGVPNNHQWIDFNDDLNIKSMTNEKITESINEFFKKTSLLGKKLIR
jgi:hypothetical protein